MSEQRTLSYRCPCCGAHTLGEPAEDEICPLCWWGDDRQDDYSLNEARGNVRDYSIVYRPSDQRFAQLRHPILGPSGETAIDRVALRQRVYAEFAQFAKGRREPLELSERLQRLIAILQIADTLYVRKI